MYRYKRLLVGLNGTDGGRATIEYAAMVSRLIASTGIPLIAVKRKGTDLSLLDVLFPL